MLQLIRQVGRKLQKGKTADMIAEELEAEFNQIKHICFAIEQCGLNTEVESIFDVYKEISNE